MKSYQLVLFIVFFVGFSTQAYGQRGERAERSELVKTTALQLTNEALATFKTGPLTEAYKLSDRGLLMPKDGYQLIMDMGNGDVFCTPITGRGEMEALIRMPNGEDIEGGGIAWCICDELNGCRIQRIVLEGELRMYCRGACGCQVVIQHELKLFSKYKDARGRWINLR